MAGTRQHITSAETALLLRQPERWSQAGSLLIIEPPEAADVQALLVEGVSADRVTVFTTDMAVAAGLPAGVRVKSSAWLAEGAHPLAIMYMPKSKARLEMLLAMASLCLAPEGEALLVGHNHSGVGAAPVLSPALIGPALKVDAARHCELYTLQRQTQPEGAKATLAGWLETWTADASESTAAAPFEVQSLPGVFSHGRLDEGTARLLRALSLGQTPGQVLDIGCGAGVISAFIAMRWPEAVLTCADISHLAVASAAHTLPRARCIPSDAFRALSGARFDHIITNPPFHRGQHTEHETTERIIREAPNYLNRGGSLWVVVNRFRDAAARVEAAFGRAERLYEDTQFTVLRARKNFITLAEVSPAAAASAAARPGKRPGQQRPSQRRPGQRPDQGTDGSPGPRKRK
jgi:16S rRNA (guanine1207-N2)-methyltransferase